jgi:two-component system, cell cycle sensor histidine kinase and response regulator CckA
MQYLWTFFTVKHMLFTDGPQVNRYNDRLMTETYQVLMVDGDPGQTEKVREFLRKAGIPNVEAVRTIRALIERLQAGRFDVVVLNSRLPDGTGLDALEQLKAKNLMAPVVMLTRQGDERLAVQALQLGAVDYLLKTGDYWVTLPSLIRKAVQASQLQLSVQRSLEKIRYQALLLNNVRDAVVVWDMDGKVTYWNPAAEGLYGVSAQSRLGLPVSEVYLSTFNPPIRLLGPEQTTGHYIERQYQTPHGKTIWVSSRMAVLRDASAGNRLIGYMDVSHDITRNKHAEQALKESEARYRAIVEDYQTELICRFTPDGELTFVNEVYCRYFGKTREELLGVNLLSFLPESEHKKMIDHLASFGSRQPVAMLEHQVILPDGQVRWIHRTDRAIFNSLGRLFEFQSVDRDITERKKMEAEIKVAQTHLIQAARMTTLGELASGIAHQINNPLTTIIADARLLLRDVSTNQPARESAEAIEEAGWRLLEVVQRLLEFSRPASDTLESLSINETIQHALLLVGAQILTTGIHLDAQLSEGLPAVRGSSRQLVDVWVNLLLLARDAAVGGQEQHIQIRSRMDGQGWVQVEVQDDGAPIPVHQLDSIFEPNFIGPSSGRGTGLELSICREIVRQHAGEIIAECAPENETIFRVSLPAEDFTP